MDVVRDAAMGAARVSLMVFDIVFIVMLALLFLGVVFGVCSSLRRRGWRRGLRASCTPWMLIDWVVIFMALLVVLMYMYRVELTRGLHKLASDLPDFNLAARMSKDELENRVGNSTLKSWAAYQQRLDAMVDQASLIALAMDDLRWYASVMSAFMCLRCLRAFRANPRLNIVLSTVQKAFTDFTHFALVLFAILCGFVVVAHSLFGRHIQEFSTFGQAFHTTFLMMMGFLFDDFKDRMFSLGGSLAVVWTLGFQVVVTLILLDMILAIVLDVYFQVRALAGAAPSLAEQAQGIIFGDVAHSRKLQSLAAAAEESAKQA